MTQTELPFMLYRHTDPWTSLEAASSVDVVRSERIVLEAFRVHGAMDDRALAGVVKHEISDSRARGARCELARAGLLKCVGTTGKPARRVWKLS